MNGLAEGLGLTRSNLMTGKGPRHQLVVGDSMYDDEVLIKFLCPCFSISEGGGTKERKAKDLSRKMNVGDIFSKNMEEETTWEIRCDGYSGYQLDYI